MIEVARSFAASAVPLKREFESREMSASFIEKRVADIDAFERALGVQRHGLETRMLAGAAIGNTMAAGIDAVRELDSLVRNRYETDPSMLTLWARTTRVRKTGSTPDNRAGRCSARPSENP